MPEVICPECGTYLVLPIDPWLGSIQDISEDGTPLICDDCGSSLRILVVKDVQSKADI